MRQTEKRGGGEYGLQRVDDERLALVINAEIDKLRPRDEVFVGLYSLDEMRKDRQEILDYQKKKNIIPEQERRKLKDGLMVEKILFDTETMDLLAEDINDDMYNRLLTESEDHFVGVIPAHQYDDYFNNVDMICEVTNALTEHETVFFAVDCTSNDSKVREKMGYRRTREQIPGFTDVKYFEDTARVGIKPLRPGALERVPRFVVGFDARLAREVLEFEPEESNAWQKEEQAQRCDWARYYMLRELFAQAKGKDKKLERYFGELLQNFVRCRGEKAIKQYPQDPVCNSILNAARGEEMLSVA